MSATKKSAKRIALYLRVSGERQRHDSQEEALRAYFRRQGWKPKFIFAEKKAGADVKRTQLDNLMMAARGGQIDLVVAFALDRLGRSLLHMLQCVGELGRLKIGIITLKDGIDTINDPEGSRQKILVYGMAAQMERDRLRDRVLAGQAAARRRGTHMGRAPTDPELIGKVIQGRAAGETFARIGAELGISASSAFRIVSRHSKTTPRKNGAR